MQAGMRKVIALLSVATLCGCGRHVGRPDQSTLTSHTGPTPTSQAPSRGGGFDAGRLAFISTGCGACHTVASAHTRGRLGPDFDTSEKLSRAQILEEIDGGANGMPSYQNTLTPREKRAVTEFIFQTMHPQR